MTSPDFIPDNEFTPDQKQESQSQPQSASPDFIPDHEFQSDDEKYGTVGQQALTVAEGLGHGAVGPIATAAEAGLTKLGVPGLTPQDQESRADTNPGEHYGSEALGFVAPAIMSFGATAEARAALEAAPTLANVVGKVGTRAAELAGLGGEGASTISKIASHGIQTGAEMAAIQASDEVSKAINQDPSQSIGSAAVNIGLSGIMGGAGGAVLGAISPLWKSAIEKSGLPKIIDDAKAQYGFRQVNPDVPSAIGGELNTRLDEMKNIRSQLGDVKGDALEKAFPEYAPENTKKIDGQIKEIINSIDSKIKSIEKSNDPYLKGSISKLEFHKNQLLDATEEGFSHSKPVEISPEVPEVAQPQVDVTPIRVDVNPNASMFPWVKNEHVQPSIVKGETQPIQREVLNSNPQEAVKYSPIEFQPKTYMQKFNALDSAKRDFDDLVNYSRSSSEDSALGGVARTFADKIRSGLEDHKIWGDAGRVQKEVNEAISKSIKASDIAVGKFTKKDINGISVSDDKVASLVKQNLKGTGVDRTNAIADYLEHTNKLADTINKIHEGYGLDAPVRLTPTPALDHTLGNSSPGTTLGNWLFDKGLATAVGEAGGSATGAGIGSLVGHPMIGAYLGEKVLGHALTSIAKPLLETASNSQGLKGAIDYIGSVVKGDKILSNATKNLFKSGSEILSAEQLPSHASREKLEKSLEHTDNPQNMVAVGGSVGHYLPGHATAAASTAATAKNYLNSLKPKQTKQNPLDAPSPIDKSQQAKYNRALDIAQHPLSVLERVKDGTLLPEDVQTLHTIYPGLHQKLVSSISDQMIKSVSEGHTIPYRQKLALGLLLGKPLDSTSTQAGMMAAMAANSPSGATQQQSPQKKQKKPSEQTLNRMQKSDASLATPLQARESSKTQS